jgi:hypothetical protein
MALKEVYVLCTISDHYPALSFQARQFLTFVATDIRILARGESCWLPTEPWMCVTAQTMRGIGVTSLHGMAHMNDALKNGFPLFMDEHSLRLATESVCAKFGKVKSLDIFPASRDSPGGGRHCLCLLQLESPAAQVALQFELKVSTFASDLAFVANVHEKWTGRSM